MMRVKIFGAGSIGNHLAYACRCKGWEVLMCDVDPQALERTRNDIYPSRYDGWDAGIRLATPDKVPPGPWDLVIIGTPPDSHMALALSVLHDPPPRVLLIEKPLCPPDLSMCRELQLQAAAMQTQVLVGYNHALTQNTIIAERLIAEGTVGSPQTIAVRWLEHWGGIFGAHPWLSGPGDTYLGFTSRGGGACGEHSHAIHIWQHFSHALGAGRIVEVAAALDMVRDKRVCYDRIAQLHVKTETGLLGSIIQDVVTEPPIKTLRIQGDGGALEWHVNYLPGQDAVLAFSRGAGAREDLIEKTRPDDFKGEIDHVADLLGGATVQSPLSLERGFETMLVIAAANRSHELQRTVRIHYDRATGPDAIE